MRRLAWVLLPGAVVLACSARLGNGGKPLPGAGGAGGSSGTSGTSGTGGSSASGGVITTDCPAPLLGSAVLRLLNGREFSNTINTIFPQATGWTNSLPADPVSGYGFDNDSSTVVGPQLAQALLDTAKSVATIVTGAPLASILPCSTTTPDRTCADTFIKQYGRLLFRRTLTQAEEDTYLTFFDAALSKSDFKTAMKWVTVGLIQSPNAIYRSEIGAVANGVRQLTQTEIATELAYTYTGTTPSDALITQAESNTLGDPVALATSLVDQVAKTEGQLPEVMQRFFEGYLRYSQIASITRDIPTFDAVRNDMILETRGFINDVVVNQLGGLKVLLTANTTNPSPALATYYQADAPNFPPQSGAAAMTTGFYPAVQRPAGLGIGLLAQGAILAKRSATDASSPTQRGLLVFTNLLCQPKPMPPPGVPPIGMPEPGVHTTRYRYETAHAQGYCGDCHKHFDPFGFGFEHFDEGGRYRQTENGLTIDSSGTALGPEAPDGSYPTLFTFQDEETLAQGLASQPLVYQCFAAYLATYAFGTGEACIGSSKVTDFQNGMSIAQYFVDLAGEPHFTQRNAQ